MILKKVDETQNTFLLSNSMIRSKPVVTVYNRM